MPAFWKREIWRYLWQQPGRQLSVWRRVIPLASSDTVLPTSLTGFRLNYAVNIDIKMTCAWQPVLHVLGTKRLSQVSVDAESTSDWNPRTLQSSETHWASKWQWRQEGLYRHASTSAIHRPPLNTVGPTASCACCRQDIRVHKHNVVRDAVSESPVPGGAVLRRRLGMGVFLLQVTLHLCFSTMTPDSDSAALWLGTEVDEHWQPRGHLEV